MPIIGTVVDTPCSAGGLSTCKNLQTLNPQVTVVEGNPSNNRLIAMEVAQGQVITLNWILRDQVYGNPIDLASCNTPFTVTLNLKEALSNISMPVFASITGTVVDAVNGILSAPLTNVQTINPGVFIGEWGLQDVNLNLIFVNTFYLVINSSLCGIPNTSPMYCGAPRMSEIRLHLRISSPGDSTLLEQAEYDAAEIAYAIQRPVMYWNEASPDIGVTYNTQTFPYRFNWLEAIVAELMIMAATSYMRDHLPYQAAGISVDDKAKWQQYMQEGVRRRMIFEKFVLQKKAAINMSQGFSTFFSDYCFS